MRGDMVPVSPAATVSPLPAGLARRSFGLVARMSLVLGALVAGCDGSPNTGSVEQVAARTLEALGEGDRVALARLAHPEHGVRFTPYSYVRPASDVALTPEQIRSGAGGRELLWGEYDGTGEPIRLTFAGYLERFVNDVDFSVADQLGWDARIGRGNSLDNCREVYPGARIVEYHIRGVDPGLDGLDWRSLRLAFVSAGESWYLVGVIHDQWTT